jgi:hypothetical protein
MPEPASTKHKGSYRAKSLVNIHHGHPANFRIMNARGYAKGTINAIMHQNATAGISMQYLDVIITVARTVDKAVVDVEDNHSHVRLMIPAAPLA